MSFNSLLALYNFYCTLILLKFVSVKMSVVTKCVTHTVLPCMCHTISLQSHTKHAKSIAAFVVQGSAKSVWPFTTSCCMLSPVVHLIVTAEASKELDNQKVLFQR